MKTMQKRTLPNDWLQQVKDFNVAKSSLSANNKIIANKLIHRIINIDGEMSLINSLITLLIKYIFFGDDLINYDDLPTQLINEALDEIKDNIKDDEKGLHLSRKIHSIFIEFITYRKLINKGYKIKEYKREKGSCDLTMEKNGETYNFEVKFKESKDILKSRLLDYIDGMSLLEKNSFLRGYTYEIDFITEDPCDRCVKDILLELKEFISKKSDIYKGKHINVFNTKKRREVSRDVNEVTEIIGRNYHISNELEYPKKMAEFIQNFINNGHIGTMKHKYEKPKKFENFCGCLVWNIPFHKKINLEITKKEFNKINLDFDLYVFLSGFGQDYYDFFIPKNNKAL